MANVRPGPAVSGSVEAQKDGQSAHPAISPAQISAQTGGELLRPYKRHVPELDGLRAIAVALVVFSHFYVDYKKVPATGTANHLLTLWLQLSRTGWLGVDIFFVLSGFLITGVLLDALGKPHFYRNFYMRRVLRIFPLYYLTLIVMLFWYGFPWKFFGLSVIFMSNMAPMLHIAMALGPLWSLSVEEHFYLFWPWMVRFVKPFWLAAISLVIIVGEPALRLYVFRHNHFQEYASWFRFDGMAMGAILAILLRSRFSHRLKLIGATAIVTALAIFAAGANHGIVTRTEAVGVTLIYTVISLLTAGVIALALAKPQARWSSPLRWRWLKFLGDLSFCIYLIHVFVMETWGSLVAHFGGGVPLEIQAIHHALPLYLAECVFVWTVTILISWLSMLYFEGPIRRRRINFE